MSEWRKASGYVIVCHKKIIFLLHLCFFSDDTTVNFYDTLVIFFDTLVNFRDTLVIFFDTMVNGHDTLVFSDDTLVFSVKSVLFFQKIRAKMICKLRNGKKSKKEGRIMKKSCFGCFCSTNHYFCFL